VGNFLEKKYVRWGGGRERERVSETGARRDYKIVRGKLGGEKEKKKECCKFASFQQCYKKKSRLKKEKEKRGVALPQATWNEQLKFFCFTESGKGPIFLKPVFGAEGKSFIGPYSSSTNLEKKKTVRALFKVFSPKKNWKKTS